MTDRDVRYIDESGRFTQTVAQYRRQLAARRKLCTAYLGSEVNNNARAILLNSDRWEGAWGDKGGRDDCGGTWDPKVWRKVWAGTRVLSDRTYIDKRGHRTGRNAAFYAALENRATGTRWLFSKMHTSNPDEAEVRTGRYRTDVGLAYRDDTAGYRTIGEDLVDQHDCTIWAASADWNINLRERWAYDWLREWGAEAGLSMCWRWTHLGSAGTYGHAIIDATLIRGAAVVGWPRVLHRAAGDDHTGELLHFREPASYTA